MKMRSWKSPWCWVSWPPSRVPELPIWWFFSPFRNVGRDGVVCFLWSPFLFCNRFRLFSQLSKETRRIFGRRSDKKVQGLPAMGGNETGNDGISCRVGALKGVIFRVVVTRIIKAPFFSWSVFSNCKIAAKLLQNCLKLFMFHGSYGMLGNVCYRFQSPLAQFSQFSCTAPQCDGAWCGAIWKKWQCTVQSKAGQTGRGFFPRARQARMTQWYSKSVSKRQERYCWWKKSQTTTWEVKKTPL